MDNKRYGFKLSMLYMFTYCCMGSFYPFLAESFKVKGLSFTKIGIILALNSILAVIFQPLFGYISDKYISKKNCIFYLTLFSSVLILLFVISNSFIKILFSMIIFTIVQCSVGPLLDAFCYEVIDSSPKIQFGRIRLVGSLGYGAASIIIGYVMKSFGMNSNFISFSIFSLLTVLIIKSITINPDKKVTKEKITAKNVKKIISNKVFILFILSVMVLNIAVSSTNNYMNEMITKTGGDVSKLGVVWFIICLCQMPGFFIGKRIIKKFNEINLLLFAILIYGIRYFCTSLSGSFIAVIIFQLLELITFSLYMLSSLEIINKIVPKKLRGTGIALFNSIGIGIGSFLGNIAGGILIQKINVFNLFRFDALLCIISLIIGLIIKKSEKNNNISIKKTAIYGGEI